MLKKYLSFILCLLLIALPACSKEEEKGSLKNASNNLNTLVAQSNDYLQETTQPLTPPPEENPPEELPSDEVLYQTLVENFEQEVISMKSVDADVDMEIDASMEQEGMQPLNMSMVFELNFKESGDVAHISGDLFIKMFEMEQSEKFEAYYDYKNSKGYMFDPTSNSFTTNPAGTEISSSSSFIDGLRELKDQVLTSSTFYGEEDNYYIIESIYDMASDESFVSSFGDFEGMLDVIAKMHLKFDKETMKVKEVEFILPDDLSKITQGVSFNKFNIVYYINSTNDVTVSIPEDITINTYPGNTTDEVTLEVPYSASELREKINDEILQDVPDEELLETFTSIVLETKKEIREEATADIFTDKELCDIIIQLINEEITSEELGQIVEERIFSSTLEPLHTDSEYAIDNISKDFESITIFGNSMELPMCLGDINKLGLETTGPEEFFVSTDEATEYWFDFDKGDYYGSFVVVVPKGKEIEDEENKINFFSISNLNGNISVSPENIIDAFGEPDEHFKGDYGAEYYKYLSDDIKYGYTFDVYEGKFGSFTFNYRGN